MQMTQHMKINGRRDNGEGTKIVKRKDRDGYWTKIWIDGSRKSVSGKTKKDVRAKVKALLRGQAAGIEITNQTTEQYLLGWHNQDSTLKPKTIHSRRVCVNRLAPFIGDIRLNDLKANNISLAYKKLSSTLSESSVKQTHAVLSKALSDAYKQGLIEHNPIHRLLSKPTVTRKEMDTLTADEAKTLLAINDSWTPMFTLMLYTGMRLG